MTSHTGDSRQALTESLAGLTERFRFWWGEPAVVGDEGTGVQLSALLYRDDEASPPRMAISVTAPYRLRGHLTGFRWEVFPIAGGPPTCSGEARRWNHFLLTREDVPDEEAYGVHLTLLGQLIEPVSDPVKRVREWQKVPLELGAATADDGRVVADFRGTEQNDPNGQGIEVAVRKSSGDRFLELVVRPHQGRNNRFAAIAVRYRPVVADSHMETEVYVGLRRNPGTGDDIGRVNLSVLAPAAAGPEAYVTGIDGGGVRLLDGNGFGQDDLETLRLMRTANSDHPEVRAVFDDVIDRISRSK